MSAVSNAARQSIEREVLRSAVNSPVQSFYWAVRRELWESRSVYVAPLAVAALFLLGFAVRTIHQAVTLRDLAALDPVNVRAALAQSSDIAAGLLMVTIMVVGAFYSIDALYGERRDRSILFWKSMPVSDTTTVLAKASIPIVVLPLLAFAVCTVVQFLMLLLSSVVLAVSGGHVANLWSLSFLRMSLMLLYHLVTVHALGPAPLYAWMLMVSAWVRRAPFVWAIVPPIALAFLEKITFNTSYFAHVVLQRVAGTGMEAYTMPGTFPTNAMTHLTPLRLLASADLWISLAVTAVFLAAAIHLRRRGEPN